MASSVTGAIVGTFKVGTGVVVGPPTFRPDKPKLQLRGKHFVVNIAGDLKQVVVPKGKMILGLVDIAHPASEYVVKVSSTVAPSAGVGPLLILRGKTGLRIVTPGRQVTGKARMTLKGKPFNRVTSQTMRPGKAKLILRAQEINKIGKAGLVPTIPTAKILVPSAVQEYGNLVPTPAYTDQELLVPTQEEFV
jgi:hypothetical protein